MSCKDKYGQNLLITGSDTDRLALEVAAVKDTIPEYLLDLIAGFLEQVGAK